VSNCIGIRIDSGGQRLQNNVHYGDYILAVMGSVDHFGRIVRYSLVDSRHVQYNSPYPQQISFSFIGPFSNNLYKLIDIKYLSTSGRPKEIHLDKNNELFYPLIKMLCSLLKADAVVLKEERGIISLNSALMLPE